MNPFPINVRDLHEFLESKSMFSSWAKRCIETHNLKAEVDYTSRRVRQPSGQTRLEYWWTLEAAEKVARRQRTVPVGEVLEYLKECRGLQSESLRHHPCFILKPIQAEYEMNY